MSRRFARNYFRIAATLHKFFRLKHKFKLLVIRGRENRFNLIRVRSLTHRSPEYRGESSVCVKNLSQIRFCECEGRANCERKSESFEVLWRIFHFGLIPVRSEPFTVSDSVINARGLHKQRPQTWLWQDKPSRIACWPRSTRSLAKGSPSRCAKRRPRR